MEISIDTIFIFNSTLKSPKKKPSDDEVQDAKLLYYYCPRDEEILIKRSNLGIIEGTMSFMESFEKTNEKFLFTELNNFYFIANSYENDFIICFITKKNSNFTPYENIDTKKNWLKSFLDNFYNLFTLYHNSLSDFFLNKENPEISFPLSDNKNNIMKDFIVNYLLYLKDIKIAFIDKMQFLKVSNNIQANILFSIQRIKETIPNIKLITALYKGKIIYNDLPFESFSLFYNIFFFINNANPKLNLNIPSFDDEKNSLILERNINKINDLEKKNEINKKEEDKNEVNIKEEVKKEEDKKEEFKNGEDKKEEDKNKLNIKEEDKNEVNKKEEDKNEVNKKEEDKNEVNKKEEDKKNREKFTYNINEIKSSSKNQSPIKDKNKDINNIKNIDNFSKNKSPFRKAFQINQGFLIGRNEKKTQEIFFPKIYIKKLEQKEYKLLIYYFFGITIFMFFDINTEINSIPTNNDIKKLNVKLFTNEIITELEKCHKIKKSENSNINVYYNNYMNKNIIFSGFFNKKNKDKIFFLEKTLFINNNVNLNSLTHFKGYYIYHLNSIGRNLTLIINDSITINQITKEIEKIKKEYDFAFLEY